jgi:hypothetical protein
MELLDPFQKPPDGIRNVYKTYQKMKVQDVEKDTDIMDIESDASMFRKGKIRTVKVLPASGLAAAFSKYTESGALESPISPAPVYEHGDMPGRCLITSYHLFNSVGWCAELHIMACFIKISLLLCYLLISALKHW